MRSDGYPKILRFMWKAEGHRSTVHLGLLPYAAIFTFRVQSILEPVYNMRVFIQFPPCITLIYLRPICKFMLAQIALEIPRVHESRVAFEGGIRGTEERCGPRMQDGIVYIPFRLRDQYHPAFDIRGPTS